MNLYLIVTPYKGSIYYQKGTHKAFEWHKYDHKFVLNPHWTESFKKSMAHPEVKGMNMSDEEKAKKLYDQNIHVHKSGQIIRSGRIGGMEEQTPHSWDKTTKKFIPVKKDAGGDKNKDLQKLYQQVADWLMDNIDMIDGHSQAEKVADMFEKEEYKKISDWVMRNISLFDGHSQANKLSKIFDKIIDLE